MTPARLKRYFEEMEAEGRSRLANFDGPIEIRRSLDMRYGEQIFEITVPLDGLDPHSRDLMDRVVDRFHRRHDELYAFSAPGQEVVIVNVRVAAVGRVSGRPGEVAHAAAGSKRMRATRRRVFIGRWHEVPVHDMGALSPGETIDGPAIVESDMTTVLLRRGSRASVTPQRWLDIRL
jgi:N-methylhydantoinase A